MIINLFLIIHVDRRQRAALAEKTELNFFEANVSHLNITLTFTIGILILNVCILYRIIFVKEYYHFKSIELCIYTNPILDDQLLILDVQFKV
jgi:hypothetical protein